MPNIAMFSLEKKGTKCVNSLNFSSKSPMVWSKSTVLLKNVVPVEGTASCVFVKRKPNGLTAYFAAKSLFSSCSKVAQNHKTDICLWTIYPYKFAIRFSYHTKKKTSRDFYNVWDVYNRPMFSISQQTLNPYFNTIIQC